MQLEAVLSFLDAKDPKLLTTPLHILLNALRDLDLYQDAKPARILEPGKVKGRQRDDMALKTVKVVSAVIMDQLHEYAGLTRPKAAEAVARTFSEFGLSKFRGRDITKVTVAKWRDQARKQNSTLRRKYRRLLAIDAEALAGDYKPERKRAFLLNRLSVTLISFGASGHKADKIRQRLAADIQRRIPDKPHC
jgi:hypothetical protein